MARGPLHYIILYTYSLFESGQRVGPSVCSKYHSVSLLEEAESRVRVQGVMRRRAVVLLLLHSTSSFAQCPSACAERNWSECALPECGPKCCSYWKARHTATGGSRVAANSGKVHRAAKAAGTPPSPRMRLGEKISTVHAWGLESNWGQDASSQGGSTAHENEKAGSSGSFIPLSRNLPLKRSLLNSSGSFIPLSKSLRLKRSLLTIGVISSPRQPARRDWIRAHMALSSQATPSKWHLVVVGIFVIGSDRNGSCQKSARRWYCQDPKPDMKLEATLLLESRTRGDLLEVSARDYLPYAVAEKSLAWLIAAAHQFPHTAFVAKADDDTLVNVNGLLGDLWAMQKMQAKIGLFAYYGTLRWRLWHPRSANGACGSRSDGAFPQGSLVRQLRKEASQGGICFGARGPYPFTDGALSVYSLSLLNSVIHTAAAKLFEARRYRNWTSAWVHEDAGIGFLVYNATVEQQLRTAYISLDINLQARTTYYLLLTTYYLLLTTYHLLLTTYY